jgi:hypothetical protein
VVIAETRQAGDDRLDLAVARNPQQASAFQHVAVGHEEISLVKHHAGPRPALAAARHRHRFSARLDTQQSRLGEIFAVGIARLDHV